MISDKELNLLIINDEINPVPAVNGGAVELLDEFLINENETNKFANITITCPFSQKAKDLSKKYKNTNIIYIKGTKSIYAKIINFIDACFRKFLKRTSGIYYIHKVKKIIENNAFDVILIENRPLFGIILRKYYKGKIYLHLHNDFVNINTMQKEDIIKSFDKIIAVSNFIKNRILEIAETNVDVVYNGIDLELYKQKNVYDSSNKKIIYSGRLVKEKGLLELVKAFNLLQRKDVELLIAGQYDYGSESIASFKKEFESLIRNNDHIKLLGYIPNKDINNYYKISYFGVLPTIINESFCLSAVEMEASGLPVICTKAGGLLETVSENSGILLEKNNLINNLYNAMEMLLNSEELRNNKSQFAISFASKFSKESFINNMINSLLK